MRVGRVDLEAAGASEVALDLEFEAVEPPVAQNFAGGFITIEGDGLVIGEFRGWPAVLRES